VLATNLTARVVILFYGTVVLNNALREDFKRV